MPWKRPASIRADTSGIRAVAGRSGMKSSCNRVWSGGNGALTLAFGKLGRNPGGYPPGAGPRREERRGQPSMATLQRRRRTKPLDPAFPADYIGLSYE